MTTNMKPNFKAPMNQSGFALFLVLIMMIVIAFLVVATIQSTSMDTRTSANDSDHQFALQNAQTGIIAAEEFIGSWPAAKQKKHFTCNCTNGLCAAKNILPAIADSKLATVENCGSSLPEVWKRDHVFDDTDKDPSIVSSSNTTIQPGTSSDTNNNNKVKFRYVIEYLGPDTAAGTGIYLFRITSKGWGLNASTTSIVEENVQAALYDN